MGDCIHVHSFEGLAAKEFEKGIWIKSLSVGKVQLRHMEFEPGSLIPDHRHPEEVVTMILEGEMEMTVGGETRRVRPGEVLLVPSNTDHSGRIFGGRVVAVSWSAIR